jgi:hypothetical protein
LSSSDGPQGAITASREQEAFMAAKPKKDQQQSSASALGAARPQMVSVKSKKTKKTSRGK